MTATLSRKPQDGTTAPVKMHSISTPPVCSFLDAGNLAVQRKTKIGEARRLAIGTADAPQEIQAVRTAGLVARNYAVSGPSTIASLQPTERTVLRDDLDGGTSGPTDGGSSLDAGSSGGESSLDGGSPPGGTGSPVSEESEPAIDTIQIYVDRGRAYGHAWVALSDGSSVIMQGLYPDEKACGEHGVVWGCKGIVYPESDRGWSVRSRPFQITASGYQRAVSLLNTPQSYSVLGHNCADFAVEVAKAAGVPGSELPSNWPVGIPRDFADFFVQHGGEGH